LKTYSIRETIYHYVNADSEKEAEKKFLSGNTGETGDRYVEVWCQADFRPWLSNEASKKDFD
jgi:hypothetical protein